MVFEIFPRKVNGKKQWFWRIRGANGEILCSSESLKNKRDCEAVIVRVQGNALGAEIVELKE